MFANQLPLLVLTSLGCIIAIWCSGGRSYAGGLVQLSPSSTMRTFLGVVHFGDLSMAWGSASTQSSLRPQTFIDERSLHGIKNDSVGSLLGTENDSAEAVGKRDETKNLPTPILLNQIWQFGANTPLNDGIKKGLHNVGIFLLGWFVLMCAIGGIMRCYLCCETMWSGSNNNLQGLCNSFADRESYFENEEEGIALDALRGTADIASDGA
eukprot:CAMPEP_0181086246 /NCGR_PEP_ID=MMETSP1071-20121207/5645_1 /TAXON_ID=35127 /ORGANISM="Thalassiosira sp., Strain NH16" /LENGTH=209 /DNA_ID=CAMNT_0023168071 /DNA_START=5 /DNA_END=634 /DNA_ORIENTATION=+